MALLETLSRLDILEKISVVVAAIVAAASLGITAWQMRLAAKVARATLWLEFRKMLSEYQDVHVNLRPQGKWYGSTSAPSPQELPRVEAYLGLLEHGKKILDDGLIDWGTFRDLYAYRLRNILANPVIVCAKLVHLRDGWKNFIQLSERLKIPVPEKCPENCQCYCHPKAG